MTALRFAVVGSPVAHSKSPAMHGAAFRALGLPHTYERLETSDGELPARLAALRDGTYAGMNVTVPHKTRALALADDADRSAAATGAANTLVVHQGRVTAHNTDAPALAAELARLLAPGVNDLHARSAIVLGSGGAARAAVFALGMLAAREIVVRARAASSVEGASRIERELAPVLLAASPTARLVVTPLSAPASEAPDLGAIVQATTAGMTGAAPGDVVADAIAWPSVPADAAALDVVYAPPRTPFLARAAARGLRHDHGLGMLVGQGALALELWLGVRPPIDAMRAAL